jgi:predicted transcriptional regulator
VIISYPLERLIARETFAEMLDLFEPEDLAIAVLRLEGLSDTQIGSLLGVTASATNLRLKKARQRIMKQLPEWAPLLRGRSHRLAKPRHQTLPLEHGWLLMEDQTAAAPSLRTGLTTADVARLCGVTQYTVGRWVRQGHFPHAYKLEPARRNSPYRIPVQDLATFVPPGQASSRP